MYVLPGELWKSNSGETKGVGGRHQIFNLYIAMANPAAECSISLKFGT